MTLESLVCSHRDTRTHEAESSNDLARTHVPERVFPPRSALVVHVFANTTFAMVQVTNSNLMPMKHRVPFPRRWMYLYKKNIPNAVQIWKILTARASILLSTIQVPNYVYVERGN